MGVLQRMIIFTIGTFTNGILVLFLTRAVLPFYADAQSLTASGPATSAMNLVPQAMTLAIGVIQVGLLVYLLGGLGTERTVSSRRGMP